MFNSKIQLKKISFKYNKFIQTKGDRFRYIAKNRAQEKNDKKIRHRIFKK